MVPFLVQTGAKSAPRGGFRGPLTCGQGDLGVFPNHGSWEGAQLEPLTLGLVFLQLKGETP